MDFKFKDYRIRRVHRRLEYAVDYLAVEAATRRSVVIRVGEPQSTDRDYIRHEFEFISDYYLPCFLQPIELACEGAQSIAVYDFPKHINLKRLSKTRRFSLAEKFEIAIKITAVMARINAKSLVLRILNSHNIAIDEETGAVYITDLTAATGAT